MDPRIQTAIHIIQTETSRDHSIRELARRVNLSPWHFAHMFKGETLTSPKQYLKNCRMQLAELLLTESFLSVKEVAAKAGFGDRSHFSRDFKRVFGHAPSDRQGAPRK